jgi:hypothetical protein
MQNPIQTQTPTQTEPTRQTWVTPQVYDLNGDETESGRRLFVEDTHTSPSIVVPS